MTIAAFKCFVHIPYQVSEMKMNENMAEGAVTLIPSAQFMKTLSHEVPDLREPIDAENNHQLNANESWTDFVEFYTPRYRDYFYTFDSWEELKRDVKVSSLRTPPSKNRLHRFFRNHLTEQADIQHIRLDWAKIQPGRSRRFKNL
jgi:hypothetical protein